MQLVTVKTKRQMRAFVRTPQILHGTNPCFAPPIWLDEANAYTGKTNPILKNSDFELFLLLAQRVQLAEGLVRSGFRLGKQALGPGIVGEVVKIGTWDRI